MMPRDLNKLMMVVNTSNGDTMREFCQTLMDLFDLYQSYQNSYKSQQLVIKDKKIDNLLNEVREMRLEMKDAREEIKEVREDLVINQEILTEINTKFDVATDDRAPKTKSIHKRDKFVIVKINKINYQWSYYVIRVQHGSLKQTLKRLRTKYPNYTEFITISYQPNGINFFNLLKEKLKKEESKIDVKRNEVKLLANYSEAQFLQDIKDLDLSKKEVDLESEESD